MIRLREARPEDLSTVERLLTEADLTTAGVADHVDGFIVAEDDASIVGCAGLETYGAGGLLRSVAVRPNYRNHAVGRRLVKRALDRARESGVQVVYLLTNAAADYFTRIGFERIQRDQVDPVVQQSQEFSTESCDSATAMRLMLGQGGAIDDSH